jgi:hypothetical protein
MAAVGIDHIDPASHQECEALGTGIPADLIDVVRYAAGTWRGTRVK